MAHFKKHTVILYPFMVLVFILSGCARIGTTLEHPQINLAHIRITEIKLFETLLEVDLRVFNTNDVPLDVKAIDCRLELNGKKIASGVSKVKKTIPAFGSEIVPLSLYSSVLDVFRGLMKSEKTEKLTYKISGKVHIAGGFLLPSSLPFASEGEISLEKETNKR